MENYEEVNSLEFNTGLPPKSGTYYRKVWHYFAHHHRIELLHYDVESGWEINRNGEKYIGWTFADNVER